MLLDESGEAPPANEVLTIGHSTRSLPEVLECLVANRVTTLVDVRSTAHNSFFAQFSRDRMKMALLDRGIVYTYLGDRLGRQPGGDTVKNRPTLDRLQMERSTGFQEGIDWICIEARNRRPCLFCGEADPTPCHRSYLVAQNLLLRGVRVFHIMPDGRLEEAQPDLFHLPGGTDGYHPAR